MSGGISERTDIGEFLFDGNEARIDSTVDDASAIRLGAPSTQRALGKISGDIVTRDDQGRVRHREEVTLIILKQTEDAGNVLGSRGGEVLFMAKKRNTGSTDDAMIPVFSYDARGVYFHVPVSGLTVGAPSGNSPRVYFEGNNLVKIYQNDGNEVVYLTRGSTDESTWVPLRHTGPLIDPVTGDPL